MCFLCRRDEPFAIIDDKREGIEALKERAAKVKEVVDIIQGLEDDMCSIGRVIYDILIEEQYKISRSL